MTALVYFIVGFVVLIVLYRRSVRKMMAAQQSQTTAMTYGKALSIFEFQPDAKITKDMVQEKYIQLMKKYHPDVGGTEYFAKELGSARDMLLKHLGGK